ncbi:MAG TPA: CAP domain-containing protein [Candidatus Angelobacter sp.]|nr:CAP domain-containing protein [Candidatus Angelobacter sp.]
MFHRLFVLSVVVAALFTPDSVSKKFALGPAEQTAILSVHNQLRREVGTGVLKWSPDLAETAQNWANHLREANGCKMEHSGSPAFGENLYWASPVRFSDGRTEVQAISPEDVVHSWGDEKKSYSYEKNSCRGVCGHYTQLVWAKTTNVGCGKALCPDKSQVWVCNYKPAGNIIGQKPY